MSNITDSMARYIDNIPDGALHTCSDLCITAPCLIVRGKREIERLRAERDEAVELLRELVALVHGECPSLLDEDRGGDVRLALHIDAFLAKHKEQP